MIHILGMSGSLRQGSFNTALLHFAARSLPEGAHMEVARFDEQRNLTDVSTQQHVVKFLQALVEFSARMKRAGSRAP